MQNGTCLITGGAGFIGCAVAPLLLAQFSRVIVADILHPQVHPQQTRPAALKAEVELIVEDVTNSASWERILDRTGPPTAVLHLAAETGTGQSLTEASRHALVNVVGTTLMLDAFSRRSWTPRHIVLASSRAVYGEGTWRRADGTTFQPGQRSAEMLQRRCWDFINAKPLAHEGCNTPTAPTSVYGATKLAQEHVLRAWALSFGAACSILRLQNVYGAGQSLSNPYTGILPLFARAARNGHRIPLFEDGQMVRDFVCVDDAAAAFERCLQQAPKQPRILDIGSGQPTTISNVAQLIANHYGGPAPYVSCAFRNGDVRHSACNITPAVTELGWKPRIGLREGLAALCNWVDRSLSETEHSMSGA